MDAFVQLALIEKARRVFTAGPGTFLSFPLLTPLTFSKAELTGLTAPSTPEDYIAAADFSRMANFLPRDMVVSASDQMLWSIYADVLSKAEVAKGNSQSVAPVEETELLYRVDAAGRRHESEALLLYKQYRDAWFIARENYASHKLTGELSDDPAIRRAWTEMEEPRLRAIVDDAESRWESVGRRSEIEAALSAERARAQERPSVKWAEWREAFNPDLDLVTESTGSQYAPTGFSPRDFAEQQDWMSFELSASEMRTLVDAAPAELKSVLDDSGLGDVEKVTFDYRSVGLVRPWFHPEAFTSCIWRSGDPSLQLSDGGDPANGTCPGYTTACIFMRNLVVTRRPAGGASTFDKFKDLRFTLDAKRLVNREMHADPAVLARIAARRELVSDETLVSPAASRAFRTIDDQAFTVWRSARGDSISEVARAWPRTLRKRKRRWPTGQPAPTPTPTAQPSSGDELSVLAFICKRLAKAPDPGPDLVWA